MKRALYFVTFLFIAASIDAEILKGKVIGVSDGDTITVLTSENKNIRVHLAQMVAPHLTAMLLN